MSGILGTLYLKELECDALAKDVDTLKRKKVLEREQNIRALDAGFSEIHNAIQTHRRMIEEIIWLEDNED